ncbi:MAG TPA: 4Fe-4S binding protein [Thermoflexia bacterium]|nr:4Fe-4S binding protein [Thermoflexia bacterium]
MREKWALPKIDVARCTGCGLCVTRCPHAAVALVEGRPVFTHPRNCTYCGLCEEVCPTEAIVLTYQVVHISLPHTATHIN